ncbi:uncharacterized protein LOC131158740 [Malania oleifera]|uniref:uncharacterized protein LOC131158740 n=1 Tax=Malania oleifera TaxID=397392 RepID=UPI0025AE7D37|nr:uncharacterized protein LOC131158740 [Malania oleifera]
MAEVVWTNRGQDRSTKEMGCSIDQFIRLRPSAFVGSADQVHVENWIQEIENILDVLNYMENQKVTFATFKLAGEAVRWWVSVKKMEELRPIPIALTWARFKELFFEWYFLATVRNVKMEEFMNLTQESLTVQQYTAKFQELSRFDPFVIPDEVKKAWKFQRDLRKEICRQMTILQLQDFAMLVDKATVAEKCLLEDTEVQVLKKRLAPPSSSFGAKQGNWKKNSGSMSQNTARFQRCPLCGRRHPGQCWLFTGACMRCGKQGHQVRDCGMQGNSGASRQPFRGNAQAQHGGQ